MRKEILVLGFMAFAFTVTSTATAQVSVRVGINPFIFGGYAPPVVYQPYPYYRVPEVPPSRNPAPPSWNYDPYTSGLTPQKETGS